MSYIIVVVYTHSGGTRLRGLVRLAEGSEAEVGHFDWRQEARSAHPGGPEPDGTAVVVRTSELQKRVKPRLH